MEKYLTEEYNVIEDENYLKTEEDIEGYFSDNGNDFLDCGQGYYTEEADLLCKVGDKFYEVSIEAEITSAKQDRGDRLYWVEKVTSVTYNEVDKPLPKSKQKVDYSLTLTNYQKSILENFMKENHIEF